MMENYDARAELAGDRRAIVVGDAESVDEVVATVLRITHAASARHGRRVASFYTHRSCLDDEPCLIVVEGGLYDRRYHVGLRELALPLVLDAIERVSRLHIFYEGHRLHDNR